jgi:hypothetical protein
MIEAQPKLCLKIICYALALTTPYLTNAQDSQTKGASPFSTSYIQEKLMENTISSENDKSVIPDHVYYQAIFQHMLNNNRPGSISAQDWTLIGDLPSHSDEQFTGPSLSELMAGCAQAEKMSSADDALDVAAKFDTARENKDRVLNRHYQNFLSKLSEPARKEIDALKEELIEKNGVGYSTLDMTGFALELPEVAFQMIDKGCEKMRTEGPKVIKGQTLKMKDEYKYTLSSPIGISQEVK